MDTATPSRTLTSVSTRVELPGQCSHPSRSSENPATRLDSETLTRLLPALPRRRWLWSWLPICPMVALQSTGTRRISPEGSTRVA